MTRSGQDEHGSPRSPPVGPPGRGHPRRMPGPDRCGWRAWRHTGPGFELEQRTGRLGPQWRPPQTLIYLCPAAPTQATFAGLVDAGTISLSADCVTYGLIDTSRGLETTLGYGTIDATRRPTFESAPDWHLVLIGVRDGAADQVFRTAIGAVPIRPIRHAGPSPGAVPSRHPTGQSRCRPARARAPRPQHARASLRPARPPAPRPRRRVHSGAMARELPMFSPPSDDAAGHSSRRRIASDDCHGRWLLQRPSRRRLAATSAAIRTGSGRGSHRANAITSSRVCSAGSTSNTVCEEAHCPHHRGVLGPAHGDDHDPGRYVHARLRVLRREDRTAHLVR